MAQRECEALQRIQFGHVQLEDFAPPQVFSSGLFEEYGVTLLIRP